MNRFKKFAIGALAAVAVAVSLGAASSAEAHPWHPNYWYGPHYYHPAVVLTTPVVVNAPVIDTSVAVMYRVNSTTPWTIYARYGSYNDAVGVADTLRARGLETLIQ